MSDETPLGFQQAFPLHEEGMSIRTWLAGLAMQGICASAATAEANPTFAAVAKNAVRQADALLEELSKKQ